MPTNLLKKYPDWLELDALNASQRKESLLRIFKRDIEDNESFQFQRKAIYPIKTAEPDTTMQTLFNHLTTQEIEEKDEKGKKVNKRVYEPDRSKRLHWIRNHIETTPIKDIEIFSIMEWSSSKKTDVARTYIYDTQEKYVIVLEPQRTGRNYYLLTAYYLNKSFALKQMSKKMKNKLPIVH
jgi:hypothetical protein